MKKAVLFLLFSFSLIHLRAQEKLSLSLAIEKAIANNYGVLIVKNDQAIAEHNNSWGTAGGYPTISLSGSYTDQIAFGDEVRFQQLNPGININWTIFSGFRIKATKSKLETIESLAMSTTQQRIENTVKDIILAYYGVLMEAERVKLNRAIMGISGDRYKTAQVRKELGAAVTFDVLQAKNEYLSDSAEFLSQRQRLRSANRLLSFILADKDSSVYELTEKFDIEEQEYRLVDLINRMESNNKAIQIQKMAMTMAQKDIKIAKSEYYPNLSLNTGLNYTWQSTQRPNQNPNVGGVLTSEGEAFSWMGRLTLSWTLFNGGNRKRQIQNAKIDYNTAELNIEQLRFTLNNQITNEFENYEVRKELLHVSLEAEESAKLNLQIAKEKFERGAINSFNYRDIQTAYMSTAQGRLMAVFNLVNSRVELMRLIGEIVKEK